MSVSLPSPSPHAAAGSGAKSNVRGGVFSLGAKLLFWQPEPSRNHWNSLFLLSCCGEQEQALGTVWLSQGWEAPENEDGLSHGA